MPKILSGAELVGYIKERQAKQVRALRQAAQIFPKLVILKSPDASPVIDSYIGLKQRYAVDILIETVVEALPEVDMPVAIERYNEDPSVHGIIVQLPLPIPDLTDEIVCLIEASKDVDGLGEESDFDSATATAINWLLAGYSVDLQGKVISVIGQGRLVGRPLTAMWRASGHNVIALDETNSPAEIAEALGRSQVIVSATGKPRLLTSDLVPSGATVIDAGTASEDGVIVGDADESLRERQDIAITPEKGGVGPLTVAALFDNLIQACLSRQNSK